MYRLLHLRIAVDHDVRLPKLVPGLAMLLQQLVEAGLPRRFGERQSLFGSAAPILSSHGYVFGKGIRLASLYRYAHQHTKLVLILDQLDIGGAEISREADGRGLGHRQTLFGLTIEPQRQIVRIAVLREHMRVAVIPDRRAVGRGMVDRLQHRHVVGGDGAQHLVSGHGADREARLVGRPKRKRER